jgi:uncharacterized protein (DUF952 family)
MAVQLGYDNIHSQNWYDNEAAAEKYWNKASAEAEYEGRSLDDVPAPEVHHDTINQAELYNGMAVQLGYDNIHSQNWYDNEAAAEKYWNKASAEAEYEGRSLDDIPAPVVHHDTIN